MKKIESFSDFYNVVNDKTSELMNIKPEYLSEAGQAALEAYKGVLWYLGFHETIKSLKEDESFMNLVSVPNKHPEYYRVLRTINRFLEKF